MEEIAETGTPRETVLAAGEALSAWGKRPDAAMWHPVSWAEGIKV
jgi:hypothetical protein